jgi:glycosyltransferase involved in cell wall biosynthesis
VISDNASTDRTPAICRAYQAEDARVRYFRNERNIGAAANFNRVFELSGSPLFHGGACDDLYGPTFLERCVEVLDRDPGVVLSHTRTKLIGEQGEPLLFDPARKRYVDSYGDFKGTSGDIMRPQPFRIAEADSPAERFREVLWLMGWSLPLSGVIRKEALLTTALYANYSGADKVLLAELALKGRFHEIGDELFAKRIHRGCTHYKSTRERAETRKRGGNRHSAGQNDPRLYQDDLRSRSQHSTTPALHDHNRRYGQATPGVATVIGARARQFPGTVVLPQLRAVQSAAGRRQVPRTAARSPAR